MATLQQQPIHTSRGRLEELLSTSDSTCSRCRGLLVKTFCVSPEEGIAGFQIEAMKCLKYGDLFDSTILENRLRSQHHQLNQQNTNFAHHLRRRKTGEQSIWH
jgi:hypothetical protein